MVRGRRQGFDVRRIITLGDTVPVAVGGVLLAMLVATILPDDVKRWLVLDPRLLLAGQVWRLFTWVFPQGDAITLVFAGFVLHWLGRDLAHTWSERRFLQAFFGYAAWAAACIAIWWQTALGRAVTDLATAAGIAAVALLTVWTLTALHALVAWRAADS